MSTSASVVENSGSVGIIIGVIVGVIIVLVLTLVFMSRNRTKVLPDPQEAAVAKAQQDAEDAQLAAAIAASLAISGPVTPSPPPLTLATSRFIDSYNQPEGAPDQLYALMTTERHCVPLIVNDCPSAEEEFLCVCVSAPCLACDALPFGIPRSYQLEAAVHSLILAHAQRAGIDRSEADGFFQTLRTNALRAAMQVDFPTDDHG